MNPPAVRRVADRQDERAAARARHPAAGAGGSGSGGAGGAGRPGGWRPDVGRMARRLAAELRAQGHPCPETAATLLAERGRLRLDRASFAARLGLEPAMLAAIEDGRPQLVDGPRAPGTV